MIKKRQLNKALSQKEINELKSIGFNNVPLGYVKKDVAKEIDDYILMLRTHEGSPVLSYTATCDDNSVNESIAKATTSNCNLAMVHKPIVNYSKSCNTDSSVDKQFDKNDITTYSSIKAIQSDSFALTIGFDCKFSVNQSGICEPASYQLFTYYNNISYEFVFVRNSFKLLELDLALAVVLDYINYWKPGIRKTRYTYCDEFIDGNPVIKHTSNVEEARKKAVYCFRNGQPTTELIQYKEDKFAPNTSRKWSWFLKEHEVLSTDIIPIQLVCHHGLSNLSRFFNSSALLNHCNEAQGGVFTLRPINNLYVKSRTKGRASNSFLYPVSLSIRDTLCHTPKGLNSLDQLGKLVGINNIKLNDLANGNMHRVLHTNPKVYMESASTDAIITWAYASTLFGINKEISVTINSVTTDAVKAKIKESLNIQSDTEYDRVYRGFIKETTGLEKIVSKTAVKFLPNTAYLPINLQAEMLHLFAKKAFHGGYNICSEVGYFPLDVFNDYDLKSAYPTAMCLCPDIDWEAKDIIELTNVQLTLEHFFDNGRYNPILPMFAKVNFAFPNTVKYPCLPVYVDGVPVCPLSNEGGESIYASGPELYLALQLGATINVEKGYVAKTKQTSSDQNPALATAIKSLVVERSLAKEAFGKNSIWDLLLKLMVNGTFGKSAQSVRSKTCKEVDEYASEFTNISSITNPVVAALTTCFVRCTLIAALNQINDFGYKSVSVTTDGFISNCPESVLAQLDLFGFRELTEQARAFLTDNADLSIWEAKHSNIDDLLNVKTRVNNSMREDGVNAHFGYLSDLEPDSYQQRYQLRKAILSRLGGESCSKKSHTSFNDIVKYDKEFMYFDIYQKINFKYDMKRKPEAITQDFVPFDGQVYEIAHVYTVPYANVSEYVMHRDACKKMIELKTVEDYDVFFKKIERKSDTRDAFIQLKYCIMFHRVHGESIPGLERMGMSVNDKVDWINSFIYTHDLCNQRFSVNAWKDCRRPEKFTRLTLEECQEMMNLLKSY